MPLDHLVFELNGSVLDLVVEFDAPLRDCRFEFSLEGAHRCGQAGDIFTYGGSHGAGFLYRGEAVGVRSDSMPAVDLDNWDSPGGGNSRSSRSMRSWLSACRR